MTGSAVIPLRPYLFRALYDWVLDNHLTPHMLVDATVAGVSVPAAFVRDGKITLNIHPHAVRGFHYDNERVNFSARFNGQSVAIEVPMRAVLAVFAKENGRGLFFQDDPEGEPPPDNSPTTESGPKRKAPVLKRIK